MQCLQFQLLTHPFLLLHPLGQSITPFVVMSETQEMELHDAEEVAMDVLECQRPSKAYATTYKG